MIAGTASGSLFDAKRGVSLTEFVGAKGEPGPSGTGVVYVPAQIFCTPERAQDLQSAGVQMVRLVTNPFPLMNVTEDQRADAIGHVMECADRLLSYGIAVIVDVHFWSPNVGQNQVAVLSDPVQFSALRTGLVQLAIELKRRPQDSVALEPFNEPPCKLNNAVEYDWPRLQEDLIMQLRKVAPMLPLVVTGCSGALDQMMNLVQPYLFLDNKLIFSFHFYEPFVFTHQYVWGDTKIDNIEYPPQRADRENAIQKARARIAAAALSLESTAQIDRAARSYINSDYGETRILNRLREVADWARDHRLQPSRVFVGEYAAAIGIGTGAGSPAVRASEIRWLTDVHSAIERFGFLSAFWTFPRKTSYAYDESTNFMKSEYLKALGLRAPK
ncbi:glycoside hydrolase family 5 protein [Bradyrhizobium sp. GCM10028915]|uniref:glycoside hydrolase family 5 protein n=1 Tax=Bradyrhizobium sp. GCM10028915 TaxID=3273385 RepID=UPI00361159A5